MSRLFNGTTDRIAAGNILNITGTALTVAAWIYPGSITHQGGIVTKWGGATATSQWGLQILATGNVQALIGDATGSEAAAGATTLSLSTWYHVALRKSGTGAGALQMLLNGVADASVSSTKSIQSTTAAVEIGRIALSNTVVFSGRIGEVGIWNVALSPTELLALAKGALPSAIRRSALQGYPPILGVDSPEPDYSGSRAAWTLTGTTRAPHPPVMPGLMPKRGFQPMPV